MRKSVEPVSNISMVKTMTEAFASASPLQALALFVVLLAIAVAAIQLGRVTTWSVRGSRRKALPASPPGLRVSPFPLEVSREPQSGLRVPRAPWDCRTH